MSFEFEEGDLVFIKPGSWDIQRKDLSEFSFAFAIIKTRHDNEIGMSIGVPYRKAYEIELQNVSLREKMEAQEIRFIPEHFLAFTESIRKTDIDKDGNLI